MRELAADILSNPPFEEWNDSRLESISSFLEWISSFFSWMDGIYVTSPSLYWLVLGLLLLAALVLIVHIAWSVRIALAAPGSAAKAPPAASGPPAWGGKAIVLASEGRFLEATHCLALGSVQALVEAGHVELTRSEANRVLRRRIRSASLPGDLDAEFLRLLDAFEARWFRDRVDDPELYAEWRALYGRISALPETAR